MKGEGLSSVASSGWQGDCRPYLAEVTELSPYLIKEAPGSALGSGWSPCITIVLWCPRENKLNN